MLRLYHRSAFVRVSQISFVMSSQGFGKTLAAHHNYTLMLRKNSSSQRAQRLHNVHKEKLPRREKKRSWLLTDWV